MCDTQIFQRKPIPQNWSSRTESPKNTTQVRTWVVINVEVNMTRRVLHLYKTQNIGKTCDNMFKMFGESRNIGTF